MKKRNPAVFAVYIAAVCLVQIVLFRSRVDMDMSIPMRLLTLLGAVAVTLPLHEVIHWCLMRIFGVKDARIEFARDPSGLPSLRTIGSGQLPRIRRTIMLLAPFVLLTVVPDVIFCLTDRISLFFFIAAICNAAGCCFDIMDAVS